MLRAACSFILACSLLIASTAEAATYYVRNGGNDNADGRSHNTAWASLTKVNKYSFAAGDVVLLRAGDRFAGTVTVDWAGTSTSPATLGSYYLSSNGTPTRGYQNQRPIIDGENKRPSDHFDALVRIRANRVRVENIKAMNSLGRAIDMADSSDSAIVGSSGDYVYDSGLFVLRSPRATIMNNYVGHAGLGFLKGAIWGAAIAVDSSNDVKVRNNIVAEVYGEGINTHGGSRNTVIEGNHVYAARAVGIYADAAPKATIRRNVVVGTTNSEWWRTSRTVGAGIVLNNEKYHYDYGLLSSIQTQGAKVYGNLVAYTSSGFAIWGEYTGSIFDSTLIFNNTFVDNDTQVTLQSDRPRPNSRFINNILLSLSSGTRDVSGTDLGGMIAKNNYFSQGNPGGGFAHTGNRYSGLQLTRMSGWRQISSRDQITWRDFQLKQGSAAISAGDDEPRRMANDSDTYQLDYNVATHNTPMDMGGLKYANLSTRLPSPPQNLALVD